MEFRPFKLLLSVLGSRKSVTLGSDPTLSQHSANTPMGFVLVRFGSRRALNVW